MSGHPSVAVVIVNWNGHKDTIECLASLLRLNYHGQFTCCIIDNKSSDGSVGFIESWCLNNGFKPAAVAQSHYDTLVECFVGERRALNEIHLICNSSNDGFAVANNIGIKYLRTISQFDWFWFLNNDTVVERECLTQLVERVSNDAQIGICGGTLLFYASDYIVQAYGGVKYSVVTGRGKHLGANTKYSRDVDVKSIEPSLTYVSGACMFVSRRFIDEIGFMCEDYFLYNEELDWAWRARGKYALGFASQALVWHKEGASIGTASRLTPHSVLADFFQSRNKLMFARKFTPWFFPLVWSSLFLRAFKRLRGGQVVNAREIFFVLFGKKTPDNEWFKRSRKN